MALWRTHNGLPIVVNGKGAIHDDCCCDDDCCDCVLLQDIMDLALNLEVTISGDITGVCIMVLEDPTHGGICKQWKWDRASGTCTTGLGGCDATYILAEMFFFCPSGGTAPSNYQFESNLSNAGCGFADGDATPLISAKAWKPVQIDCTDQGNGIDDFYAKFIFPLEDIVANGCDACGATGQVIFEVRVV